MSVIMIMRVSADPAAFERYARANADQIARITDAAKAAGALRHEFVAGDGEVLAIDEWPDEASFHRFFAGRDGDPGVHGRRRRPGTTAGHLPSQARHGRHVLAGPEAEGGGCPSSAHRGPGREGRLAA